MFGYYQRFKDDIERELTKKKRLYETKLVFLDESIAIVQYYKITRQLEKKNYN